MFETYFMVIRNSFWFLPLVYPIVASILAIAAATKTSSRQKHRSSASH